MSALKIYAPAFAQTPGIANPWSSLVEGDEQLDRPNSQTTMKLCHECVALFLAWADPAFTSCSMANLNVGMDEESHLLLLVHFWLQDFDLERSPRDFWRPPDFPSTDSLKEIPRIWGATNPTKTSSWSSSSLFGLARPAPWRVFRPAIQRDCSRSNAKNSCKLFLPSVGINQIRLQNGT